MKSNRLSSRAIACFLCCFTAIFATTMDGHSGATGIVKERMDLMKEMGDASKVIADMVKRKRTLDAEEIRGLADDMQRHAAQVPELFPDTKDSREGRGSQDLSGMPQGFPATQRGMSRPLKRISIG